MRDKTTCPSFANFKKKDIPTLAKLLIKALEGQLEALRKVEDYERALEKGLEKFLKKAKKSYKKYLEN